MFRIGIQIKSPKIINLLNTWTNKLKLFQNLYSKLILSMSLFSKGGYCVTSLWDVKMLMLNFKILMCEEFTTKNKSIKKTVRLLHL